MLNSPDENTQILDSVKDFYSLQDKILTSSATATSNPTKKIEYEYTTNDLYSKTVVSRPVAEFCKIRKGEKVTMLSNGEVMSGWEDRNNINFDADVVDSVFSSGVMVDDNRLITSRASDNTILLLHIDRFNETVTLLSSTATGEIRGGYFFYLSDNIIFQVSGNDGRIIKINDDDTITKLPAKELFQGIPLSHFNLELDAEKTHLYGGFVGSNEIHLFVVNFNGTDDFSTAEYGTGITVAIGTGVSLYRYSAQKYIIIYGSSAYYLVATIESDGTISFSESKSDSVGTDREIINLKDYCIYASRSATHMTYSKLTLNSTDDIVISDTTDIMALTLSTTMYYTTFENYIYWVSKSRYSVNYICLEKIEVGSSSISIISSSTYDLGYKVVSLETYMPFFSNSKDGYIFRAHYYNGSKNISRLSINVNTQNQANNIIGSARNTADGDLDESCEIIIDGLDDTNSGLVVNTDYYVNRDGSLTTDDTDGVYFGRAVSSTKIAFQSRMKTNTLDIRTEAAVATETDETKFSHKLPIKINGVQYYVMLTQT